MKLAVIAAALRIGIGASTLAVTLIDLVCFLQIKLLAILYIECPQ